MADTTARHRRPGVADHAAVALRRLEPVPQGSDPGWPPGWVPEDPRSPAASPGRPDTPVGPPPPADGGRLARLLADLADRVPAGLRAALWSPRGRALAGLVLLVSLAVAVAIAAAWLTRPHELRPAAGPDPVGAPVALEPAAARTDGASAAETEVTPAAATTVFVHVAGAVRRPGLVELPAGSRVADAVGAAGGPSRRAETASVNLARPLVDGEQVVVLRRGQRAVGVAVAAGATPTVPAAPGGSGGAGATGGAVLDLNAATPEQLDSLPGIGPVLAARIIDWRTANGRFTAVDELGEVKGIGEATLAELRPVVTV